MREKLKVTNKEISGMDFQMAMQKLTSTPCSGHTAYLIKLMNKEIKVARENIYNTYKKEIADVYAKRDEQGNYDTENFIPDPDKLEAFQAAVAEFEKKEVEIDRPKFTAGLLEEFKLTAREQEALDPILDDSDFHTQPVNKPMKLR